MSQEDKWGKSKENNTTNKNVKTITEGVLKEVKYVWIQETVGMLQYHQIFKQKK